MVQRRPSTKPKAFADHQKPAVAVDVVCLSVVDGGLSVLAYERAHAPYKGTCALPGGFVGIDEPLEAAAARLLRDKAGVTDLFIEQLFTFGSPKRDPRGRVITVAYYALLDAARFASARALKLRVLVPWTGETGGPVHVVDATGSARALFLDHTEMIGLAVKRLRGRLDYSPVGFQLLPRQFTLRALQDVHEAVLGAQLNKDSFRRRILDSGLVKATGKREDDVPYRPAALYRFVRRPAVAG